MQRFLMIWVISFLLVTAAGAVELNPSVGADGRAAVLPTEPAVPHIALLLPLKSAAFRSAAGAVQQGFYAASTVGKSTLPVRVYGCADESKEILALYAQALAQGARAVVGPLTRNGVNLMMAQTNIPVPTLALNMLENQPNTQLYGFGMAMEGEARLVAQLAAENGLHQVVVVSSSGQFALRMQLAFEDAWNALGGKIKRQIEFSGDPAQVSDIVAEPDTFIFLAGNAQQARVMRPYLPKKLPVYTTSQLFINNAPTNFEFNGIHFVDMPWLVQPDSPLVLSYPRAVPPLPIDLERLYALGIDAYRLIQLLLQNNDGLMALDGVSGSIQLNGHQFQRMAMPATFVQGRAQAQNASPAEPVSQTTRP